jgi:mannose-1-phosphate guanylyltransferase
VVGARAHRRLLRRALAGRQGVSLLLEPAPRSTAVAIAWAAATVRARAGPAMLAVLPSDHHIPDAGAFARAIRAAADLAHRRGALVLIGIEPTRADTAYGYLRVSGRGGALEVIRFVEKPNARRALRYLRGGAHLWNSGIVVGSAEKILGEIRARSPEVSGPLQPLLEATARGRAPSSQRLRACYRRVKPISFDHAVLERTRGVLALRARFAWSDLGSWDALGAHLPRLRDGNRQRGDAPILVGSRDNLVWNTSGRAVALLGVSGLIVVDTPDALLVCSPRYAQQVRRVVGEVARRGWRKLL